MADHVRCGEVCGGVTGESGAVGLLFRQIFSKEDGRELSASYNDILPGGNSKRHAHPEEHITLVVSGSGVLEAGGARLEISGGSALYIHSNEPHCFFNTGSEPLVLFGIIGPSQCKRPH